MNFHTILFIIYSSFLCILPLNYLNYNVNPFLYLLCVMGMVFSTLKSHIIDKSIHFMTHHIIFHTGLLLSINDGILHKLPICAAAYCFLRISKRHINITLWKFLYIINELACSIAQINEINVSSYPPLSICLMMLSQVDSFESISKFDLSTTINQLCSICKHSLVVSVISNLLYTTCIYLLLHQPKLFLVVFPVYGIGVLFHNTQYLSYVLSIVFTHIIFSSSHIYVLYILILCIFTSKYTFESIYGTVLSSYTIYSFYSYIVSYYTDL